MPAILWEMHEHPSLSQIDELQYIDYLHKVDQGHLIIRDGEPHGSAALRDEACRGVLPVVPIDPAACTGPTIPPNARNSADIDPPSYYIATAVAAKVLRTLHITSNFVTSVRLVDIVWAGAGLTALFLLMRLLGVNRLASGMVTAITLDTSLALDQWHYATPHAADVLVGALAAIVLIRWLRHEVGWWALVLVGVVPPLMKASDVVVAGAIVLVLLTLAVKPVVADERERNAIGAACVVGGLAVSTLAWLLVRNAVALTHTVPFPMYDVTSFHIGFLTHQIGAFVQNPVSSNTTGPGAAAGPGLVLLFWMYGNTILAAVGHRTDAVLARVAGVTIVVAFFGSWLFVLSNYVLLKQYVAIPDRYGLTLLPLLMAFAARGIYNEWHSSAVGVAMVVLAVAIAHPAIA